MRSRNSLLLALVVAGWAGSGANCGYSLKFTDVSFSPELESVTVANFENQSSFVVPGLTQRLTEALRNKFLRETNVFVRDAGGDWEFAGTVTRYEISPISPTGDEVTALNRLTIAVRVEFVNHLTEDADWTRDFSRYADFDSSIPLADVEDGLIEDINGQLVQDIFNEIGSDW